MHLCVCVSVCVCRFMSVHLPISACVCSFFSGLCGWVGVRDGGRVDGVGVGGG